MTNGIVHARTLAEKGYKVFLLGGELKAATEAVVGGETMESLKRYHFTKGFLERTEFMRRLVLRHRTFMKLL